MSASLGLTATTNMLANLLPGLARRALGLEE